MMRNGVIGSTADSDSVSRGSSPFSVAGNLLRQVPYFIGVWLSLVERYVRDVEVASSNLVTPILMKSLYLQALKRKEHFNFMLECSFFRIYD